MSYEFECLILDVCEGIATITLNRPDEANCLNPLLCEELRKVATICENDRSIRAVLLTGAGRFFCAGGDLADLSAKGDQAGVALHSMAGDLHSSISTFTRMEPPLVVAVNGVAAGAGFSLAAIGNIVLASDNAAFTMAYTQAGLSPDGSASYFLPRIIGLRRTHELMLTNRKLTAQEAMDWGLISEIVPANMLEERANKVAVNVAKGPRIANATVKRLLLVSYENSLEAQMEAERRGITICGNSADGREGIKAFIEKRRPHFSA